MKPRGITIDENSCIVKSKDCEDYEEYTSFCSVLSKQKIGNLFHILENGCKNYQLKPCLGTRKVLGKHLYEEKGKLVEKLSLGNYSWMNYEEVKRNSISISMNLLKHNHSPTENIVIFAETRAEWLIAAMGCFHSGMVIVTLYNSLGDDALVSALNETEGRTMFTSFQLLPRVMKIKQKCIFLKTLIVMTNDQEDLSEIPGGKSIDLIKFNDFLHGGKRLIHVNETFSSNLEDTAIIMYTSGSTGIPKGVLLSHKNILASISAFPCTMHISSCDRYLALLPLAHIMELIAELSCIAINIPILYSSPKTFTSKSPGIMKGCEGDAVIGKPTFTMLVPLVLDRIIKNIHKTVKEEGLIKSWIFSVAVKLKIWLNNSNPLSILIDMLIFGRIRNLLGGKVNSIGVGGSPLSENTHKQISAIFGCSIRSGYGTTESSACITGMDWRDNKPGHVGPPNFGIYFRLVDDNITDNQPLNPLYRGEIHAGGNIIAKGYYKRPEETSECFYNQFSINWFKTGDIGEITKDGCVKILDRKRDFQKMKHGEYISLQKIECLYKTHLLIENICIIANSYKENVAAVVVLNIENVQLFPKIKELLRKANGDFKIFQANKDFRKELVIELARYGRERGLNKWEIPGAIHATLDEWSPDSGHLTGSFKIRRDYIKQFYEPQIKKLIEQLE